MLECFVTDHSKTIEVLEKKALYGIYVQYEALCG